MLCASPAYLAEYGPRLASGIGGAQVHFFRFPRRADPAQELRGMRLTEISGPLP